MHSFTENSWTVVAKFMEISLALYWLLLEALKR